MSEIHCPKITILTSGDGTTAEAFIHATQDGRVDAEVGLVICNNPPEKAGVYDRINKLNKLHHLDIEIKHINSIMYPLGKEGRGQTLEESEAICNLINRRKFDHVALMGYMKEVRGVLVDEYGWSPGYTSIYEARMTNTHPGPLPETRDTYGVYTSERVLELGMIAARHTVHLVSKGIDVGPIIAEHPVDILCGDTAQNLFDRIQIVEKENLPVALDKFLYEQADYKRHKSL